MAVASIALSAMTVATRQVEQAAEKVARSAAPDPDQFDAVDLSEQVVQLLSARTAFDLAVRVTRIANEVDQHLLDLLA